MHEFAIVAGWSSKGACHASRLPNTGRSHSEQSAWLKLATFKVLVVQTIQDIQVIKVVPVYLSGSFKLFWHFSFALPAENFVNCQVICGSVPRHWSWLPLLTPSCYVRRVLAIVNIQISMSGYQESQVGQDINVRTSRTSRVFFMSEDRRGRDRAFPPTFAGFGTQALWRRRGGSGVSG